MPPVTSLYTLLLPLIAFAVFGASRYLVVAADSATAAILAVGVGGMAGMRSPHYAELASMAALVVAVLLLLARLLRLGFLADFLSRTVFVGFLTGVGLQVGIAVSGEMSIPVQSNKSVEQLWMMLERLPQLHWPTFAISAGTVIVIFITRRVTRHMPGPLFAVIGAIGLSAALDFAGHGVAVLGPVVNGLPRVGFPVVSRNEALPHFFGERVANTASLFCHRRWGHHCHRLFWREDDQGNKAGIVETRHRTSHYACQP